MKRLVGLVIGWGGFVLSLAALAVALAWTADFMHPVQKGNAEDFWSGVWGVRPADEDPRFKAHLAPGDRYIYSHAFCLEGDDIISVSEAEVMSLFPQVLDRLLAAPSRLTKRQVRALVGHKIGGKDEGIGELAANRKVIGESVERMRAFLAASKWEQVLSFVSRINPEFYESEAIDNHRLGARLDRARHYWANIVFEGVSLGGVITLFWVPLLWARVRRWMPLIWGSLPVLILVPYFLGYCRATMFWTDPRFWGGPLYPWIIVSLRPLTDLTWTWEASLLDYVPQVLEPLNQPSMVEAERYIGPLPTLGLVAPGVIGVSIGLAVYGLQRLVRRVKIRLVLVPPAS